MIVGHPDALGYARMADAAVRHVIARYSGGDAAERDATFKALVSGEVAELLATIDLQ